MIRYKKPSGFTLVEMVVVISIMAIIGGISALIIERSLDSYAALDRRYKIQSSARLVVERISRELRNALPYSVCVSDGSTCTTASQNMFYFIPIKSSGRYQDRTGGGIYREYTDLNGNDQQRRRRLRILPSDDRRLDIISTNATSRLDATGNVDDLINGNNGDWVVVFNTNNSDIYQGTNNVRHQIHSITAKDVWNDGDPNHTIDYILFADNPPDGNSAQVGFANPSPNKRLHIIANNVVTLFRFNPATKSLYRDSTIFSAPTTPVDEKLLMENVEACSFTFIPGGIQNAAVLRIDLTVGIQGEKVQIIHEAHVYNVP